jgi:ferric-dicitrate binding protein FerR (iron transport regulator)
MMRPECQPWIDISDREAIGEVITEEERRFQRAHEATCKACADEANVWRSLDGAALESVLDDRTLEQVLLAARAPRIDQAPSSIRRASPGRRRTIVGAAVGVCALAAAIAVMARRPRLAPTADVGQPGPAPAVAPIETLPSGPAALAPATETRIAAGTAPTCRMISPGATACLGAGSEVTTARLVSPRRVLDLVRGRVVVSLAPQAPGTSFGVATAAGTVTAVGTIFSVEILANGDTMARCERGEVVVQATGSSAEHHLLAGEQLRIGDAHAAAPLPAHDRRRDLALLTYREDRPAGRGEKSSDIAEREERSSARNEKSAEPSRGLGESSRSSGEPSRGTVEAPRGPTETPRNAAEPSTVATIPAPTAAPAPTAPPRAAETAARQPVRDLLGRARALRTQGAFREAADAYRAAYASDPHGAEGRTALVALGGLLLSELNDPAGALAAFDSYLTGKGALAQEAEFGRIRALRALGRYESEKAAIQSFLVAHPEGPDAQVLRRRLESMGK